MVLSSVNGKEGAILLAKRMCSEMEKLKLPSEAKMAPKYLTFSMGIAIAGLGGDDSKNE